jgi:tetratricopeptide (TPR) repeat protein
MASLSLVFPLLDQWRQLREGTRDNIIGGLIVAVLVAAVAIFWKSLLSGLRHLVGTNPTPPTLQAPPQALTIKLEGVQAAPLPAPETSKPITVIPTPNIPRPPIAGFVARRDKDGHDIVERLKTELAPGKDQLIVLWGAGGVGKTTLAAETVRSLRKVFSGGVIWASADGRQDFGLSTLLDEIATHLGRTEFRQLAPEPKDAAVHDALASAPTTLIVLDNFETISPEEQDKCAEWLAKRASCPSLITSRDEVAHARPVNILAMSLPEAREFLQKLISQARNPRAFDGLDHEQIIQAADRIPLVLQWVVKRIDSAKQPQVVLDDLAHGEGDAAKRVFDRSFDLPQVGDDGRATLLALSLFVPSASRLALAEVAGFGNDTEPLDRAVRQLAELWLIETTEGNQRLSVEGLTRELAKARLLKDEHADEFRQRFVACFLSYAEAHAEATPEDYDLLEAEKDNLVIATDVALSLDDWESERGIVDIVADPVTGVLAVHGYWDEAIRLNDQALGASRRSGSESDQAVYAHNLAVMRANQGELDEARRLYHESLEISKRLGDQGGIARRLHQLGLLAQAQGELDEARQLYNESLGIEKMLGNQSGIARTTSQLGIVHWQLGERTEAKAKHEESLAIRNKIGDQLGIAIDLHQLAMLAEDQGELDEARRLYNESREINKSLGNQAGIAITLHQLGRLAEHERNNTEAVRLFSEALAIFERLKSPNAEITRRSLERVKGKSS